MVVAADFMPEGSEIYPWWTGNRVLGEHAALCVYRWVGMVENGLVSCTGAGGRLDNEEGRE